VDRESLQTQLRRSSRQLNALSIILGTTSGGPVSGGFDQHEIVSQRLDLLILY